MKELFFCIFIFLGRTIDVSIGSIRVVFLVKGKSLLASFFAFIEIIIWFIVIQKVILSKVNFIELICYASGYSLGTFIGSYINKRYVQKK